MNKAKTALLALAVTAPLLVQPVSASEPQSRPAPWLVAQRDLPRPTCESDKRQMPRGAMVCREGKEVRCGPYGNWVETGRSC